MKPQQLTALLLSALSACSSASHRPNRPFTGPTGSGNSATVSCEGSNMRLHLARLRWSPEVESIAVYAMPTGAGGLAPGSTQRPVLRFSGGAPCTAACEAEREAVAQSFLSGAAGQGWVYSDDLFPDMYQPSAYAFAVVRRGGTSQLVASLEGLRAHLAGLDTPAEAQAWASLHRLAASCNAAGPNARTGQAWHELVTEYERCEQRPSGAVMARIQVIRRVYRDGRIESGAEQEVGSTPTQQSCAVPGRMPLAGLEPQADDGSFGALLAHLAQAEAVSVVAFRELAGALAAADAPASLIARAERAAEDEARHAALMSAHARRNGATVREPSANARSYPSLLALALHNAEEGCVKESYAALVTLHQARFAVDSELRGDLHNIAQDELEHATWSHDLDAWLQTRLTPAERLAVAAAKDRALTQLASCSTAPSNVAGLRAGLPEPHVAAQLVAGLQALLREAGPPPPSRTNP